jgi:hypothetical protein
MRSERAGLEVLRLSFFPGAREISDSVLLKRLLLCIARGRVCHLRDESQKLEHGNPERPLGSGAELASETGDG